MGFDKSFVVLIIGNSKSNHLGALGTCKVKQYLVKADSCLPLQVLKIIRGPDIGLTVRQYYARQIRGLSWKVKPDESAPGDQPLLAGGKAREGPRNFAEGIPAGEVAAAQVI